MLTAFFSPHCYVLLRLLLFVDIFYASLFSTLLLHLNFLYTLCILYMLDVLFTVTPELFCPFLKGSCL